MAPSTSNRKLTGPELTLYALLALTAVPIGWWSKAYVLVHIWSWYRPAWALPLPFRAALGVSFVVACVKSSWPSTSSDKKTEDPNAHWYTLIFEYAAPWIVLLAARICLWIFYE